METTKCKFVHVDKMKIKDPIQIQFVKTMRLCGHKVEYYKSPDGTYEGPAVKNETNIIKLSNAIYEIIKVNDIYIPDMSKDDK